jgi:hypothetical protein
MFDTDARQTPTSNEPLRPHNTPLFLVLQLRTGRSVFMAYRLPYK